LPERDRIRQVHEIRGNTIIWKALEKKTYVVSAFRRTVPVQPKLDTMHNWRSFHRILLDSRATRHDNRAQSFPFPVLWLGGTSMRAVFVLLCILLVPITLLPQVEPTRVAPRREMTMRPEIVGQRGIVAGGRHYSV